MFIYFLIVRMYFRGFGVLGFWGFGVLGIIAGPHPAKEFKIGGNRWGPTGQKNS